MNNGQKYLSTLIKVYHNIYLACLFQAIAFFTALPFLIGHGLGFTKIALLGNILLNPALLIFMLLSSLIFFLELFNIPSDLVISLLEKYCYYWIKILQYPSSHVFYISQAQAFITISICTIVWLISKNYINWKNQILVLYVIINILCLERPKQLLQSVLVPSTASTILYFKNNYLEASLNNQGLVNIRNTKHLKKLCRKKNFVDFELKPSLSKHFGTQAFVIN